MSDMSSIIDIWPIAAKMLDPSDSDLRNSQIDTSSAFIAVQGSSALVDDNSAHVSYTTERTKSIKSFNRLNAHKKKAVALSRGEDAAELLGKDTQTEVSAVTLIPVLSSSASSSFTAHVLSRFSAKPVISRLREWLKFLELLTSAYLVESSTYGKPRVINTVSTRIIADPSLKYSISLIPHCCELSPLLIDSAEQVVTPPLVLISLATLAGTVAGTDSSLRRLLEKHRFLSVGEADLSMRDISFDLVIEGLSYAHACLTSEGHTLWADAFFRICSAAIRLRANTLEHVCDLLGIEKEEDMKSFTSFLGTGTVRQANMRLLSVILMTHLVTACYSWATRSLSRILAETEAAEQDRQVVFDASLLYDRARLARVHPALEAQATPTFISALSVLAQSSSIDVVRHAAASFPTRGSFMDLVSADCDRSKTVLILIGDQKQDRDLSQVSGTVNTEISKFLLNEPESQTASNCNTSDPNTTSIPNSCESGGSGTEYNGGTMVVFDTATEALPGTGYDGGTFVVVPEDSSESDISDSSDISTTLDSSDYDSSLSSSTDSLASSEKADNLDCSVVVSTATFDVEETQPIEDGATPGETEPTIENGIMSRSETEQLEESEGPEFAPPPTLTSPNNFLSSNLPAEGSPIPDISPRIQEDTARGLRICEKGNETDDSMSDYDTESGISDLEVEAGGLKIKLSGSKKQVVKIRTRTVSHESSLKGYEPNYCSHSPNRVYDESSPDVVSAPPIPPPLHPYQDESPDVSTAAEDSPQVLDNPAVLARPSDDVNSEEVFKLLRLKLAESALTDDYVEFQRLTQAYYASLTSRMTGGSELDMLDRCVCALERLDITKESFEFKPAGITGDTLTSTEGSLLGIESSTGRGLKRALSTMNAFRDNDFRDTRQLAVLLEPFVRVCDHRVHPPLNPWLLDHFAKSVGLNEKCTEKMSNKAHVLHRKVRSFLRFYSKETSRRLLALVIQRSLLELSLPQSMSSASFITLCVKILYTWLHHPDARCSNIIRVEFLPQVRQVCNIVLGAGPNNGFAAIAFSLAILRETLQLPDGELSTTQKELVYSFVSPTLPMLFRFLIKRLVALSKEETPSIDNVTHLAAYTLQAHLDVLNIITTCSTAHRVIRLCRGTLPRMLHLINDIVLRTDNAHSPGVQRLIGVVYNSAANFYQSLIMTKAKNMSYAFGTENEVCVSFLVERIVRGLLVVGNCVVGLEGRFDGAIGFGFIEIAVGLMTFRQGLTSIETGMRVDDIIFNLIIRYFAILTAENLENSETDHEKSSEVDLAACIAFAFLLRMAKKEILPTYLKLLETNGECPELPFCFDLVADINSQNYLQDFESSMSKAFAQSTIADSLDLHRIQFPNLKQFQICRQSLTLSATGVMMQTAASTATLHDTRFVSLLQRQVNTVVNEGEFAPRMFHEMFCASEWLVGVEYVEMGTQELIEDVGRFYLEEDKRVTTDEMTKMMCARRKNETRIVDILGHEIHQIQSEVEEMEKSGANNSKLETMSEKLRRLQKLRTMYSPEARVSGKDEYGFIDFCPTSVGVVPGSVEYTIENISGKAKPYFVKQRLHRYLDQMRVAEKSLELNEVVEPNTETLSTITSSTSNSLAQKLKRRPSRYAKRAQPFVDRFYEEEYAQKRSAIIRIHSQGTHTDDHPPARYSFQEALRKSHHEEVADLRDNPELCEHLTQMKKKKKFGKSVIRVPTEKGMGVVTPEVREQTYRKRSAFINRQSKKHTKTVEKIKKREKERENSLGEMNTPSAVVAPCDIELKN